jgi:hypothetical protein
MTSSDRKAVITVAIYGLSVLGAGVYSKKKKGKSDWKEIGTDAVVYGGIVGTGLNVVYWLQVDATAQQEVVEAKQLARENKGQKKCGPYGNMASKGLAVLSQINPEVLYKAAKLGGVTVEPEGKDPHRVVLPAE